MSYILSQDSEGNLFTQDGQKVTVEEKKNKIVYKLNGHRIKVSEIVLIPPETSGQGDLEKIMEKMSYDTTDYSSQPQLGQASHQYVLYQDDEGNLFTENGQNVVYSGGEYLLNGRAIVVSRILKRGIVKLSPDVLKSMKKLSVEQPVPQPRGSRVIQEYVVPSYTALPLEKIKNQLGAPFSITNPDIEVEVSFGHFSADGEMFFPGLLSVPEFMRFKNYLDSEVSKDKKTVSLTNDEVTSVASLNIRKIVSGDQIVYQKKQRSQNFIEDEEWGLRVYTSQETEEDEYEEIFEEALAAANQLLSTSVQSSRKAPIKTIRRRNRFSYSLKMNAVVDLTIVDETKFRVGKNPKTQRKYELEIEKFKGKTLLVPAIVQLVKNIFLKLQGTSNPSMLIALPERMSIVRAHNQIFGEIRSKHPYLISSFYRNKPKNVTLDDMIASTFDAYPTIKLNGTRCFVYFHSKGIYAFAAPFDVRKIYNGIPSLAGTFLDCENLGTNVVAFDLLYAKGKDYRPSFFDDRYAMLVSLKEEMEGSPVSIKRYYTNGNFFERIVESKKPLDRQKGIYANNDGLILQPINTTYKNEQTYKWKRANQLTIDFLFVRVPHLTQSFTLQVLHNGEYVVFRGSRLLEFSGVVDLESDLYQGMRVDGNIFECKWNADLETFDIERIRIDRDQPNKLDTAQSVWRDIQSPLTFETLAGDNLQRMRRYSNLAKSKMLRRELKQGDTILDIGSGRGGDLGKWESLGLSKVFVVEPDDENSEELARRKTQGKYKVNVAIISTGAEDTSTVLAGIHNSSATINAVTAFFSLTFFMQSQEVYNGLLQTLDKVLSAGGKFIGIVMDGLLTRELLEEHTSKGGKGKYVGKSQDGTTLLTIREKEFKEPSDEDAFGNEITIDIPEEGSMVKKQTEWLFNFQKFTEDMKNLGFSLQFENFLDHLPLGGKDDVEYVPPDVSKLPMAEQAAVIQQAKYQAMKKFTSERRSGPSVKKLTQPGQEFIGLNVAFTFVRSSSRTAIVKLRLRDLTYGKSANLDTQTFGSLVYTGVDGGNNSFISAVLYSASKKFRDMSSNERQEYMNGLRRKLAVSLSEEVFFSLHNGLLAERYIDKYKDPESALSAFKKKIANVNGPIGEVSILELLAEKLDVNIFVLQPDGGKLILSKEYTSKYSCEVLYDHLKSIIILKKPDGLNYYSVGVTTEDTQIRIFSRTSKIIQKILENLC